MAQKTEMNSSEKPNSSTTNAKNAHIQTAIEWIYNILTSENWEFKTYEEQDEIYQKAKQMEKEQIMKAVDRGYYEGCKFPGDMTLKNAEQYYNETFGA